MKNSITLTLIPAILFGFGFGTVSFTPFAFAQERNADASIQTPASGSAISDTDGDLDGAAYKDAVHAKAGAKKVKKHHSLKRHSKRTSKKNKSGTSGAAPVPGNQ